MDVSGHGPIDVPSKLLRRIRHHLGINREHFRATSIRDHLRNSGITDPCNPTSVYPSLADVFYGLVSNIAVFRLIRLNDDMLTLVDVLGPVCLFECAASAEPQLLRSVRNGTLL